MRVAIAPWLDIDCQGRRPFRGAAVPGHRAGAGADRPRRRPQLRVALALGLPSARPGLPGDLRGGLRAGDREAVSGPVRRRRAVSRSATRPGCSGCTRHAQRSATGAFDACVVAGVDSYLAPETLEWLEENEQLHGAGPLNNAWGFIPGEGAGAVLLVTERGVRRVCELEPLARVLSVGTGVRAEPDQDRDRVHRRGADARRSARRLAALPPGAKVTDVFCDMNGEPYRADEFGFAACARRRRSSRRPTSSRPPTAGATCRRRPRRCTWCLPSIAGAEGVRERAVRVPVGQLRERRARRGAAALRRDGAD